jgi:ribosomal-protein-alanine acetyltransferase
MRPAEAATIRPAERRDLPALLRIEQAAFAGDRLSPRSFRRLSMQPSAALFVVEAGGRIAGYGLVLFRRGAASARLYSLAVAPEDAGRGHGRRLLAAAEAIARDRGCKNLMLEVRVDNPAAIALYERSGYRTVGLQPNYYQDKMSALRFAKSLASASVR